jgi:two-component system, LuxR family, response regulator FixJ
MAGTSNAILEDDQAARLSSVPLQKTASLIVSIIDADDTARGSTAALLEEAGYTVRTFESGDAFLSGQLARDSDCVVLDLHMAGTDGIGVLTALQGRGHMPPILVLTGPSRMAEAVAAMRLGAVDFFEKPYEADSLLEAIGRALASKPKRKAGVVDAEAAAKLSTLSRRQIDVLHGILGGQTNKSIAGELGLSMRTVEAHRTQLLVKLGVRRTAEVVRLAVAAGMPAL